MSKIKITQEHMRLASQPIPKEGPERHAALKKISAYAAESPETGIALNLLFTTLASKEGEDAKIANPFWIATYAHLAVYPEQSLTDEASVRRILVGIGEAARGLWDGFASFLTTQTDAVVAELGGKLLLLDSDIHAITRTSDFMRQLSRAASNRIDYARVAAILYCYGNDCWPTDEPEHFSADSFSEENAARLADAVEAVTGGTFSDGEPEWCARIKPSEN